MRNGNARINVSIDLTKHQVPIVSLLKINNINRSDTVIMQLVGEDADFPSGVRVYLTREQARELGDQLGQASYKKAME